MTTYPKKSSNTPLFSRIYRKISREIGHVQRRRIAARLLASRPSAQADHTVPFSVHSLVCKRDVGMAICSAKSLNLACNRALPWFFHDDGSLGREEVKLLQDHFPGCTVLTREYTDQEMSKVLVDYPLLRETRRKYVMMLKLADLVFFAPRERILYVDSDILFFTNPTQLLEAGRRNLFNRDIQSCYLYPPPELRAYTGIPVLERINAGLSSIWKEYFEISKMEQVLAQNWR